MENNQTGLIWQDRKHHLWFPLSFTKYYIENDRLMVKSGLLNTTLDELLLYRVVDITMKQTLAGKIFGTGNIIIKAKVDKSPEIILQNIAKPLKVRTILSDMVEEIRQKRNVVGKEFYGNNAHEHTDLDHDDLCDME